MYIQSCAVDGKQFNQTWLPESVLTDGGTWTVLVGSHPNKAWASDDKARPWSMSRGLPVLNNIQPASVAR